MPIHDDGYGDAEYRTTISYIDRSRRYYASKGFEVPYRWAKHRSAPFTPLSKPLSSANVALITTAKLHDQATNNNDSPPQSKARRQSRFQPFAAQTANLPELSTDDLFWHKSATHTNDRETYLPLNALHQLAAQGTIGRVNERIFGVPTVYSHRRTDAFAAQVADWCAEDQVDVALLVPI